jgi:hypothetical protein
MLHVFITLNIADINFNSFTSQPPPTTLQICDKLMEFYMLLHSDDYSKFVGSHSVNCNHTVFYLIWKSFAIVPL